MTKTKQAILPAMLMMLAACSEKIPPEEVVTQRALERWEIRKAGRAYGLYEFLSPTGRQLIEKESYESQFGSALNYIDAKVTKVDCKSMEEKTVDICYLTIYVKYKTHLSSGGAALQETWVLEDKQWWLVND